MQAASLRRVTSLQDNWKPVLAALAVLVVAVVAVMIIFEPFASGPAGGSSSSAPRRVYVGNGYVSETSKDISAFSIGTGGSLNTVTNSPFNLGGLPAGLVIRPNGTDLYVNHAGGEPDPDQQYSVSRFVINSNGALSGLSTAPYVGYPSGLAISPDGAYLYVGAQASGIARLVVRADGSIDPAAYQYASIGSDQPTEIAIAPDGSHLYVTSEIGNRVHALAIAANGTLSEIAGSPWEVGTSPKGVAVAPDGSRLYVANRNSQEISAFEIEADGSLTELAGSPFSSGGHTMDLAISPDGSLLYAANEAQANVTGFRLAADGGLTELSGSPFGAGDGPQGIEFTPDGSLLYVANKISDDVSGYSVAADGALTEMGASPFATGRTGTTWLAISPDQGPTASFSVAAPAPGSRTAGFDASSSSDPDGTVARYDWSFGDGASLPNGGPSPSHTYPSDGAFTATLTVIDDEGCSGRLTYNGQMAWCNGGSRATTTRSVAVTPAAQPPVQGTAGTTKKKCKKGFKLKKGKCVKKKKGKK